MKPSSARRQARRPDGRLAGRKRRKPARLGSGWREVLSRIRAARRILLLLDFDGTLTPLRELAEQVQLAPATRALLSRLARHPRLSVWIISGRTLADLRRRARAPGMRYLGLHGWEGLPGARLDARSRLALVRVRRQANEDLAALPGIQIEDKRLSLAVHYRGASPATARQARRWLEKALRPFAKTLRVLKGKKVWEVLPRAIGGKGEAVRALLARYPSALPVYIGDDTSDEEAFRALPGGLTIRVGKSSGTRARFLARDPQEVIRFLQTVASERA